MSRSLLASALLCACVPTLFAAAPPDGPLPSPKVKALIEQLGDRDFRVRDQAEKRLRDEGAAALPQLRKALKDKDLEVRRRALRLVPSIESAVLFSPRRVTFRVRDLPLDKVLKELSKASGYAINDNENMGFPVPFPAQPNPNAKAAPKAKTFSYDFVNVPFWDAVERICKDAGLAVQQSYGDDVLRFYKSNGHAPLTARYGPFRVVANNLSAYRNVDLSSSENLNNRSESLTLNFTVFAEPRLPFMSAGEPRLDSAYDDLKNSMVPRHDLNVDLYDGLGWRGRGFRGRYYSHGYKQLSMQVSVQLERRSERATTLKVVKGVVPMTVLVKQEPVVISDKILSAKGVKKDVGDLTFEIQEVKKAGANQVSVKFQVTSKKGNDYTWQNNLYNRVELLDDKGNKYQNWGSSWGSSGPGGVQMTLTYSNGQVAKPGEPARFAFMHWETKQYDVEFEFRDVPLP